MAFVFFCGIIWPLLTSPGHPWPLSPKWTCSCHHQFPTPAQPISPISTILEISAPIWCHIYYELSPWERPWFWERSKAGGEWDGRGWDDWMASLTQCTWVWTSSRSWWWTGRPSVLWSMGLHRIRYNWATELSWWCHNWKSYQVRSFCLYPFRTQC